MQQSTLFAGELAEEFLSTTGAHLSSGHKEHFRRVVQILGQHVTNRGRPGDFAALDAGELRAQLALADDEAQAFFFDAVSFYCWLAVVGAWEPAPALALVESLEQVAPHNPARLDLVVSTRRLLQRAA